MKKLICVVFIVALACGVVLYSQDTKKEKPEEETKTAKTACIKEIGGYWYAYIDYNGSYDLIWEKSPIFKEEIKKQGIKVIGSYFITFYNSPKKYKGDELEWAVSAPIDKDTVVKEPLKKRYLAPIKAAYIEHKDHPNRIWDSFYKVEDLMEAGGWDTLWPAYEIYNKNPLTIEVIHPLIKKDKVKKKEEEKKKEEKKKK